MRGKVLAGPVFAAAGAAFLLSGYCFGALADAEDFNSTAVTTRLFFAALSRGENPFWTDLFGFGLPQPFRISLIQHPLGFLFALLQPLAAVKAIVAIQGVLGAVAVYALCRRFRMAPRIAGICVVSWALSWTSVEYLYYDDFFSAFLSWCLYPVVALAMVALAEESDSRRTLALGAALGTSAGLLIATGLISHVLSYLLVLAVFALAQAPALIKRWRAVFLAGALCAVIASGIVWLLVSEASRSSSDAARIMHLNPGPFQHLGSMFGLHFAEAIGRESVAEFSRVVLADPHRTIGFGPVAAIAALAAVPMRLGPGVFPVKAAFLAAVAFMLLPPAAYVNVISATWVFRDGVNLFGVLLFGLAMARLFERPALRRAVVVASAAQMILVLTMSLPPWLRMIDTARHPDRRPNLAVLAKGDLALELRAVAGTGGRILMSPALDIRRRSLFADGMVANTGALHGLRIVNVWARGIATGSLSPERALLEGNVAPPASNFADPAFLEVLAIRYVLSSDGEKAAPGLELIGAMPLRAGDRALVWRNAHPWPAVAEIAPEAGDRILPIRPMCEHDRFLCSDFTEARKALRSFPTGHVVQEGGRIRFRTAPASEDRTLLINSWYRPEWTSIDERVEVVPVFGQMLGVTLPAGAAEFTLAYRPIGLMAAYILGTLAIVAGLAMSATLLPGGWFGRRLRPSRVGNRRTSIAAG